MPFKDTSYLQNRQPFCLAGQNHLGNFGRRQYEEHFCEIILYSSDSGGDISYLELWQVSCSVGRNCLGNFGRRHNEEHFCFITSRPGS